MPLIAFILRAGSAMILIPALLLRSTTLFLCVISTLDYCVLDAAPTLLDFATLPHISGLPFLHVVPLFVVVEPLLRPLFVYAVTFDGLLRLLHAPV